MTSLELKESFPFGGTLSAREAGFELLFYFPGPDRRYNGTFLRIEGVILPQYIAAWSENWHTFQDMCKNMPGRSFSAVGLLGMQIDLSGVRLHKLIVSSESELTTMLETFERALLRGKALQHEICQRVGRPLLPEDEKLSRFARFKAGESLGRSTTLSVANELQAALVQIRPKIPNDAKSYRHKVHNWFGRAAAEEFMADIRLHGLDVFNEQADFVISWRGRG